MIIPSFEPALALTPEISVVEVIRAVTSSPAVCSSRSPPLARPRLLTVLVKLRPSHLEHPADPFDFRFSWLRERNHCALFLLRSLSQQVIALLFDHLWTLATVFRIEAAHNEFDLVFVVGVDAAIVVALVDVPP